MTTYLGKSCSFGLPRVPFVNCRQFMYLVISLLVLRAGCGIWLYQFLIIAYLFTLEFNRKNNNFRASEYVRYLVFCNSWDALVCLNLGAGVKYLFLSIAKVSEWILWKKDRKACSCQSSRVGHSNSLSMSLTWLVFPQRLQVQWAAVLCTFSSWLTCDLL